MYPRASSPNQPLQLYALLAFILFVMFADTAYARTTTPVLCTNSQTTDRALIQTAINNSAPGDTIELIGTCQLDGTAVFIDISNLTIEGAGAAGNWSTVVSGLLATNGTPIGDFDRFGTFPFQWFNRGFSLGPSNTSISGVTIQGIKFTNLNTAVNISPSIRGNSNSCSQIQITSGSASDILVTNNWFDNDRRPVSNFGLSDHVNITGNVVTNSGFSGEDILSAGGAISCVISSPGEGPVAIQFPTDIVVQNNVIKSDQAGLAPIFAANVQNIKIIRNTVTTAGIAGILFAAQTAYVSQNSVDGSGVALAGIFDNQALAPAQFATLDHQISNNSTRNNALVGIGVGVDSGITGASVVNNQFDTSGVVNILLCDANADTNSTAAALCLGGGTASHLNTVITTNFSSSVMDLGVGNKLIGTQTLLNNPSVPSSVSAKLIQNAVGRPPLP